MTENQQSPDVLNWEENKKKLPEMLNVLTILTFIGCGIFAPLSIWGYAKAQQSYEATLQMQDKMENAPEFAKKLMGPNALEVARKSYENRLPILLLSLIAFVLCVYGAVQMRALKKTGFSIYLLGELILPVISTVIFLGVAAFGGISMAIGLLFPVVFTILYATQLKHLT